MIHGVNVLLALAAALWLSACGGGAGAPEETLAETTGSISNTDATGTTAAAEKPGKVGSVSQGESSQVVINEKDKTDETPSLTLSRLGANKLTWNEVVKAGASYLVFERTDTVAYDFTNPIQSLEDVVTLALAEKPGTHCYIIRAKTKKNPVVVDSNEICINTPWNNPDKAPVWQDFADQTVIATQTLNLAA
ncbi:MAG: hypothetical protein M3Q07_12830, partial [Pseudobdellovibrionaceae bacterium]|nr:hypothetical protein [Pseudobdellovibrionaceae bacterium]